MTLTIRNLNNTLDKAKPLPGMGIKIAEVSRDGDRAVYVVEITGKGYMTSHYHPELDGGTELYQIIEAGKGAVMCTGKPRVEGEKVTDVA